MLKKPVPMTADRREKEAFGRNLREARLARRHSQRQMQKLTGITQSQISGIEAGTRNIGVDTMVKLARAVDMPLWRLLKPKE